MAKRKETTSRAVNKPAKLETTRDASLAEMVTENDLAAISYHAYRISWIMDCGAWPPKGEATRCAQSIDAWMSKCPPDAAQEARQRVSAHVGVETESIGIRLHAGASEFYNLETSEPISWATINAASVEAAEAGEHKRHPAFPLVRAWIDDPDNAPLSQETDKESPIQPGGLVFASPNDKRVGKYYSAAHYIEGIDEKQIFVPGIAPDTLEHPPTFHPAFLYKGGKPGLVTNNNVPDHTRLTDVLLGNCDIAILNTGRTQDIRFDNADVIIRKIWKDIYRDHKGRALQKLHAAIDVLVGIHIPLEVNGKVELHQVISAVRRPGQIDAGITFRVQLPPGMAYGPRIPSARLQEYWEDAVKYRLYKNLHCYIYHPGRTSFPTGSGHHIQHGDASRFGPRLFDNFGNTLNAAADDILLGMAFSADEADGRSKRRHLQQAKEAWKAILKDGDFTIKDGRPLLSFDNKDEIQPGYNTVPLLDSRGK